MNKKNYIAKKANNWVQTNGQDCMVQAYIAGANEVIDEIKFDLLPACKDALEGISMCLNDSGDRCVPNMGDFVSVANALTIIDDFYQRVE